MQKQRKIAGRQQQKLQQKQRFIKQKPNQRFDESMERERESRE